MNHAGKLYIGLINCLVFSGKIINYVKHLKVSVVPRTYIKIQIKKKIKLSLQLKSYLLYYSVIDIYV